jgi:hypothetical protein
MWLVICSCFSSNALLCITNCRATVVYHLTLIVRGEAEELCGPERATSRIDLHDWQQTDAIMPNLLFGTWQDQQQRTKLL